VPEEERKKGEKEERKKGGWENGRIEGWKEKGTSAIVGVITNNLLCRSHNVLVITPTTAGER
jgi:hypothetical protein